MLGIGICNIIVGAMYDANKQGPDTPPDAKGWEPIMLFFAAMSVGAFACAVLLKVRRTVNRLFIGVNTLSCAPQGAKNGCEEWAREEQRGTERGSKWVGG
jgi:hypothetical protein